MGSVLVLFCAFVIAPEGDVSNPEVRRALVREGCAQAAARVKLNGPVTQKQAFILADAYFHYRVSGCGAVGVPKDTGTHWSVPTWFGYSAQPYHEIRVDKKTGATSMSGHVVVSDPKGYAAR